MNKQIEQIELFMLCKQCIDELPQGESYHGCDIMQVGKTKDGLLIICNKHKIPVFDFACDWSKMEHTPKCECCSAEP